MNGIGQNVLFNLNLLPKGGFSLFSVAETDLPVQHPQPGLWIGCSPCSGCSAAGLEPVTAEPASGKLEC